MSTQKNIAEKNVAINMRVEPNKRNLIDMAATILGRDRTSFILEAACKQAEEVILDKRMFFVDNSAFDAFERALESNSMENNKCLQSLLSREKRWV